MVVNSAGIARHGPALTTTPEDFDAVIDVDLRSAYFLPTYAAKAMKRARIAGSIYIFLVKWAM